MSPFPAATPAQGGCGCLSIRARHAITCVVRARHWRHGARDAANAKAAVDPSVPGHSRHILSTLREVSDAVAHQSRQAAFGRSTTGNHSQIAVVDNTCRNPIACWMHSAKRSRISPCATQRALRRQRTICRQLCQWAMKRWSMSHPLMLSCLLSMTLKRRR